MLPERVFYGAAIQGAVDRVERGRVNRSVINLINGLGFEVISEHTTGQSRDETMVILERQMGSLPQDPHERSRIIRRAMLELIDGDIVMAVFETSVPSLGTGIEIDHACTRPDRGLPAIPIIALYQKDYWIHGLSSMVRGIDSEDLPNFSLIEYEDLPDLESKLRDALGMPKQKS